MNLPLQNPRFIYPTIVLAKLIRLVSALLLSSCGIINMGAYPKIMNYTFNYNMTTDGQTAIILDYRLAANDVTLIAPTLNDLESGRRFQAHSEFGPMLRATSLYVKWKDPFSEVSYEDKVDLQKSLPPELTGMTIHFMIRENRLFIYLESSDRRPKSVAAIGPEIAQYYITRQIYPIQ